MTEFPWPAGFLPAIFGCIYSQNKSIFSGTLPRECAKIKGMGTLEIWCWIFLWTMVPIKFVEFFFWYGEVIIDFIIFLIILISYSHSEMVSNKRKINPVNYTHPNSSTTKLGYMYTLIWSPHTILNWWPYLSNHYYHIYIFIDQIRWIWNNRPTHMFRTI